MPPDLSRLTGLLRTVMSMSPYFCQKLFFFITVKVGCMETKSCAGKNKLSVVDDEAKGIWLCSRQKRVLGLVMMPSK